MNTAEEVWGDDAEEEGGDAKEGKVAQQDNEVEEKVTTMRISPCPTNMATKWLSKLEEMLVNAEKLKKKWVQFERTRERAGTLLYSKPIPKRRSDGGGGG